MSDLRMCGQHGLNLTRFDPETTDLHLVVHAAEEHDLTIHRPLRPVTRAIHPLTTNGERIGDKALPRQPRTPDITTRETRTSDIQLT
ncbi:hypothetical protein ABZ776_31945, partial [Streptomyces sp. NPDC007076]|uniref:hypothetical protein n=1 Tax=Streptomyces sp. NPDC007076 TaxID=3160975 RepID=UPI0033D6E698